MTNRTSRFVFYAFGLLLLLFLPSRSEAQTSARLAAQPRNASSVNSVVTAAAPRVVLKRLAPPRSVETAEGSRVTILSDASLEDYSAYREARRFVVHVPNSEATFAEPNVKAVGVRVASVARRDGGVRFTFELEDGTSARVVQKFNRLDILFVTRTQQQQTPSATATPASPPAAADNSAATAAPNTKAASTATAETNAPNATDAARGTNPEPGADHKNPKPTGNNLPPEKAAPVRVGRFDKPPTIDGKLDEDVWKNAALFTDFIQFRPSENAPPTKQTEVRVGYDARFLYMSFRAFDEPGKVRATIAKRDNVFDDDWVGVILDTFNDKRRAYEFFFNPFGVQADAIMNEDGNEDLSIDVVLESKGIVDDGGYTVEVAVPFKSLRYEAGKGKLWGVHFMRMIKRHNNEQSSWMPIARDNSSFLDQTGYITGLEGISTERTLELIPSLTVSETGRRVRTLSRAQLSAGQDLARRGLAPNPTDPGRFVNQPIEFDPGLTAKFGLTPTVTLDLAINPDFAQVEADATVVTANQRFPIFFEEKRPFFLEGKEIFSTILSAVHTRTIADPDVALKLSGKRGKNSFGVMVASDNAPGNFTFEKKFDPEVVNERIDDKNSYVGVIRLKRDVGKENHVGFLGTAYSFIDNHNYVGGPDIRLRLNKSTTFTAQALGSISTRPFFYPDEAQRAYRTENGLAYAYNLNMNGRNWGYEYTGVGRSRFFRAEVGFNRRFNTHNQNLFVRYNSTEKPKAKIISWRIFDNFSTNFDWKARSQNFNNNTQLQFRFQRQTYLGVGLEEGYERIFEEEFGPSREGNARVVAARFAPALASTLPACDQTGTLAPPIPDDPSTPENEARFLPTCTFFGADNERSAVRKTVYSYVDAAPSKKYSLFFLALHNWGVLDFDFGSDNPNYPRVSPAALTLGPDAPLDPGLANEFFIESNFNYQPTDALRLSLSYVKDRYTRQDTGLVSVDDNIYTLRGTYQFSRFVFARARIDYTTLGRGARGQFLWGWTPNPGTSLYVGYNDDVNRGGDNPFTGGLEPGFRRNGRTFFIKASYLIRRSFESK